MGAYNKVEYGPQITALNAVALNAAEAARTSDAIDVRGNEYLRVELSCVLDGSGLAATNTIAISFLGSQDNGATFKQVFKVGSDDAATAFAPYVTISAAQITALVAEADLGSVEIAGLTHIKVRATATAGSPDGDNKITVKVRAARE